MGKNNNTLVQRDILSYLSDKGKNVETDIERVPDVAFDYATMVNLLKMTVPA